jgi:hypothetical protein
MAPDSPDIIILDEIPFTVDEKGLFELLKIKPGSRHAAELTDIFGKACAAARPKAAFAVAPVNDKSDDTVHIAGVRFKNRILAVNLKDAGVAYPFIATCGQELDEWSRGMAGTLHSFWADTIKLLALGCAMGHLEAYLKERLGGSALSSMNPGSLENWPLAEQKTLFEIIGSAATAIGVSLTDKMVLHPLKSVSGIYFISEEGFTNCRLCPRQQCNARRSSYEPGLYMVRYGCG